VTCKDRFLNMDNWKIKTTLSTLNGIQAQDVHTSNPRMGECCRACLSARKRTISLDEVNRA